MVQIPLYHSICFSHTAPKAEYYHTLHDGPIVTLQRSPFFRDIVLLIGGWTFSIWKEGVTVSTASPNKPHFTPPSDICGISSRRIYTERRCQCSLYLESRLNKKVLLRERKRHTARGGLPHPVLDGWDTPSSPEWGDPIKS